MDIESSDIPEEIPIFPLATVLFPGAILPLHIFEERYKQMMQFAIDNGGTFGLSYTENAGIDRETPVQIGSVGCLARINAVMPIEDGRMNIISTGVIRYRVTSLSQTLPYLIARIKPFRDDPEPDSDLNEVFTDTLEAAKEIIDIADRLDESSLTAISELPDEPEAASLMIASALPLENQPKQTLLEMTSTQLRLVRLKQTIAKMLPNYRKRLAVKSRAGGNGHAKLS